MQWPYMRPPMEFPFANRDMRTLAEYGAGVGGLALVALGCVAQVPHGEAPHVSHNAAVHDCADTTMTTTPRRVPTDIFRFNCGDFVDEFEQVPLEIGFAYAVPSADEFVSSYVVGAEYDETVRDEQKDHGRNMLLFGLALLGGVAYAPDKQRAKSFASDRAAAVISQLRRWRGGEQS